MSITSEINRISGNISDSLSAVATKGITVPSGSNSDDLAGLIAQIPNNYSVTLNLTGASSSASGTKIISGGSYFTEITPTTAGHKISSITVTMGGVDITSQVFKPGVGAKAITANGTYSATNDYLSGYSDVVVNVAGGSSLTTKNITSNGTYNASSDGADGYSSVTVNVPAVSPSLQSKTNISPTTSSQTITPDSGYDGLSQVQINAMPSGTAGTPSASKGTVSNHSVSITPSVTNTTGYITGGTKTGTAVTVTASELVSGSETKTSNGTYDVTNLAELVVNVPSGGSSMNVQAYHGYDEVASGSYTATDVTLTVAKSGTYTISWVGWRSSSTGTSGSQLYKNGTAVGNANTTFTRTYGQVVTLTNQSLSQGDVLVVWARSRNTSYYMCVGNLIIEQTA